MSELMRRAAPGLALAGAALATVWLFDPALHAEMTATAATSATPDSDGSTDSGDTPYTDSEDSTDTGESDESGDSAVEEPAPTAEEPAASADCSDATSVTGDAAMTRWGPVQVQMEFAADGTVCGVQAIAYPADDHRSAQINSRAIPYLDAAAMQVGTEFDAVSGATYTSEAYRESMQSILDQR